MLICLIFIVGFCACAYWHLRENRELSQQSKKRFDASTAHWLVHMAWSRSIQLLLALACCLLVIIFYDAQLRDARKTIDGLTKSLAEQTQKTSEALVGKQRAEAIAPAPQPAITAPVVEAPSQVTTIEDLYSPEKTTGDYQSLIDGLKKRYENILVTYLFLNRCNMATTDDYTMIAASLSREITTLKAPAHLQNDIVTAAQGSYKEIYANSRCDQDGVKALQTQYADYIKALPKN